jgi:hypothetical protein
MPNSKARCVPVSMTHIALLHKSASVKRSALFQGSILLCPFLCAKLKGFYDWHQAIACFLAVPLNLYKLNQGQVCG